MREPYDTGWAFYFDNDDPVNLDRNYTGGMALSLFGRRAVTYPLSLDPALQTIDRWLGVGRLFKGRTTERRHGLEFGLTVFSPKTLRSSDALLDEHPYGCLLFTNNSERVVTRENRAYQTSFLVGVLGTRVCETLQRAIHVVSKSGKIIRGWNHQIADGGEPTARWRIDRQSLMSDGRDAIGRTNQLQWTAETSIGYLTNIGIGLSGRWGRISSPWWSFAPQQADYIPIGAPVAATKPGAANEFYFWAGAMMQVQLYNALLEGQFRHSDVRFSGSELSPVVVEGWAGVTRQLDDGLTLSLCLRGRTHEIKDEINVSPLWVSLTVARAY